MRAASRAGGGGGRGVFAERLRLPHRQWTRFLPVSVFLRGVGDLERASRRENHRVDDDGARAARCAQVGHRQRRASSKISPR